MKAYTVSLVGLQSRQVVVIGGGGIAARKIHGLLAAEAQVKVISPALIPELEIMVDQGKISHIRRDYQDGDLQGAFLAIAATDNPMVNQAVWAEAQRLNCLINVVDDPDHSNFFMPAIVQRGELSIAISTGGNSPALARRMRERLEKMIGMEYGVLAEIMSELRPEIKAMFTSGKARKEASLRIIDSDILDIIQENGKEAALAYARQQIHKTG